MLPRDCTRRDSVKLAGALASGLLPTTPDNSARFLATDQAAPPPE